MLHSNLGEQIVSNQPSFFLKIHFFLETKVWMIGEKKGESLNPQLFVYLLQVCLRRVNPYLSREEENKNLCCFSCFSYEYGFHSSLSTWETQQWQTKCKILLVIGVIGAAPCLTNTEFFPYLQQKIKLKSTKQKPPPKPQRTFADSHKTTFCVTHLHLKVPTLHKCAA